MEETTNPKAVDTLALIYRAARGNQDAFCTIAQRYTPMLHKILGGLAVGPNEREDLFQEGLIGLYKAVVMFDPALSSFNTFAYLCVRRSMLSAARALGKVPQELSLPEQEMAIDPLSEPETLLINQESYRLLRQRIDAHLSPYETNVLKLFLTGVSHDLIAQKLSTSRKSVDNAISRIRRKLKALIGPTLYP